MTINVQFVKVDKNQYVKELVEKKLNKLDHKFDWIIKSEVIFKEENTTNGKNKICEIEVSAPGPRIFASYKAESFEKAADSTVRELEIQLKKRKSELYAHA